MADTLEGVNAELERIRAEIDECYGRMQGIAGGGGGGGGGGASHGEVDRALADEICSELDALFTRRGALLRKRAMFPTGVGSASH